MNIRTLSIGSNDLDAQYNFYVDVMGFRLVERGPRHFTVQHGQSLLRFNESTTFYPYHFAFNIPCNQIVDASQWLKNRAQILKYDGVDIQSFNSWNAEAVYFYDADQNIVELIARKNLNNPSDQEFSAKSILEISEIGIPCENIESVFNQTKNLFAMKKYSGSFDRFCAIGSETGLYICIDKNKKTWFPTGEEAYKSTFKISFDSDGKSYDVLWEEDRFSIL